MAVMASPWVQPVFNWGQPQYYSPGYWQYVPTPYAIYQTPLPEPQSRGRFSDLCASLIDWLVMRGRPAPRDPLPPPPPEPQLHRFLGGQGRPTALWDVSQEILTARRITSHNSVERVTSHFLSQPATNPPVSRMRILFDSFKWSIILNVPPNSPQRFISIKIVLDAIYGTLNEPLDKEEWQDQCKADRKKMYREMCTRLAKSPPSITADGCIWKIDCLGDRTAFLGLRPAGPNPEEWILSLGPRVD